MRYWTISDTKSYQNLLVILNLVSQILRWQHWLICCKNWIVCLKWPKMNEKEAGLAHLFLENTLMIPSHTKVKTISPLARSLPGWLLGILFTSFITQMDFLFLLLLSTMKENYVGGKKSNVNSVWPDWAIFESSWVTYFPSKVAKCRETFAAILKKVTFTSRNCCDYFLGHS